MSADSNDLRRRYDRLSTSQFVVTLIAVALAALALFVALRIDSRTEIEVGEDVTPENAETILARANEAAQFADSILSFLEGASVVAGAVLAIGAWMLRNSIQKQSDYVESFVQKTQEQLTAREERLQELEQTLAGRLDTMLQQTMTQIETVQQQARDSFHVLSLLVLAEQQVRAHNLDTAIRTLQHAYDLAPDNHATNYLLGYLYTTRKQFDEAIARLEHCLKLEPDFAPAIAALGLALRRKGDGIDGEDRQTERDRLWAQAENKLLQALETDSRLTDADGESYYGTLGGLYRRQNRYEAALRAYEQARQVTPGSSYPIINLASLYKHQGNDQEAEAYFRQVLRAAELQLDDDPRDYWTRADYAQAKLVLGRPAEALAELRTMLEHVQGRGVLETVHSGLQFLAESPTPIKGLDDMITLIESALKEVDSPGAEA